MKNQKQIKTSAFRDDPACHTTTLQGDVDQGGTHTPAQPGDKGAYEGRYPPISTVVGTGHKFHKE